MTRAIFFAALALLCACDNRLERQKAALRDLDAAEIAWAQGDYAQAFALLEIVVLDYGDTPTAERALALHAAYVQAYRHHFAPLADWKMFLNGCGVAAKIYDELVFTAITSKKPYPPDLTALSIYPQAPELVQACDYEKGLFNAGFLLDCRPANALARDNPQYTQWMASKSEWMLGENHAHCNAQFIAVDDRNGRAKITRPPAMPAIAPVP